MTRTEYLMIAHALRRANPVARPITEDEFEHEATIEMHINCCNSIADALALRNPSFDITLFLSNCGVSPA